MSDLASRAKQSLIMGFPKRTVSSQSSSLIHRLEQQRKAERQLAKDGANANGEANKPFNQDDRPGENYTRHSMKADEDEASNDGSEDGSMTSSDSQSEGSSSSEGDSEGVHCAQAYKRPEGACVCSRPNL